MVLEKGNIIMIEDQMKSKTRVGRDRFEEKVEKETEKRIECTIVEDSPSVTSLEDSIVNLRICPGPGLPA